MCVCVGGGGGLYCDLVCVVFGVHSSLSIIYLGRKGCMLFFDLFCGHLCFVLLSRNGLQSVIVVFLVVLTSFLGV